MPSHVIPARSRWPFWLLILAWVCANSPQAATFAVLSWLAEARTFSHQRQLSVDVAHLLAGEAAPGREPLRVAAIDAAPQDPPPVPVPEAAVLKKILLSVEETAGANVPRLAAADRRRFEARTGGRRTTPPPHRPPRAADV
jgi:hypothetical protein